MSSNSSYYDIRRNLIDSAPFVENQLPLSASASAALDNNNGGAGLVAADYVDFRLAAAYRGLQSTKSQDSLSIKYRRMKCAVIVMATLMIIASMLLVGVSLAMAEHIDELVRQMNNLGSTRRPPTTTAVYKLPPVGNVAVS